MDNFNIISNDAMLPVLPLDRMQQTKSVENAKKEQFSKDFESVFIGKLLDEMKNTIGSWGFEDEDGGSEQIQGIFWSQLADNIGGNGGFGMWKDIYKSLADPENTSAQSVDNKI
jgi:Rod binding domain-containing protein